MTSSIEEIKARLKARKPAQAQVSEPKQDAPSAPVASPIEPRSVNIIKLDDVININPMPQVQTSLGNREAWLMQAMQALYANDCIKVRVSVGLPNGKRGSQKNPRAVLVPSEKTRDGVPQVFIPANIDDGGQALRALTHALGPLTGRIPDFHAFLANSLPYPHSAVRVDAFKKRDSMRKVYCAIEGPKGYKLRIDAMWIGTHGAPICPCHKETMLIEQK